MSSWAKRLDQVWPALVGCLACWCIAGFMIVDPRNIGWLAGGLDPTQHYLGWRFFLQGPWSFPLGLNPTFGMDLSSAIVFSDSLPLFAFIFKGFTKLLSEPFQYFGIWTLLCFILQAQFAYWLLRQLTTDRILLFAGVVLFVFSPAMLWRIGVTSALVGHFFVLAALYLNVRKQTHSQLAWWLVLLVCAALVHFYLLVMVLALCIADVLDRPLARTQRVWMFGLIAGVLSIALWQAGYFSVQAAAASTGNYGIGRLNLLAPFDANGWSYLLGDIKDAPANYQSSDAILSKFEGYNYLGLGVIFLGIVILIATLARSQERTAMVAWVRTAFAQYWALSFILVALLIFAISNNIGIAHKAIRIPLPDQIIAIASILRASARLFWPILYLGLFLLLAQVIKVFSRQLAGAIILIAALLQVVDTSAGWLELRDKLSQKPQSTWGTPLQDPFWTHAAEHYHALLRVPAQNNAGQWDVLANYAANHNWPTNSVFLARVDVQRMGQANERLEIAMATGKYDSQNLYILNDDKVIPALLNLNKQTDLLARINDFNVLAPGWLTCRDCPPVPEKLTIAAFVPQFSIGMPIDFSRSGKQNLSLVMVSGWDYPQPWGTWALGQDAKLVLPLPKSTNLNIAPQPRSLQLSLRAVVSPHHPQQAVEVWVNGQLQQKPIFTQSEGNHISIGIPKEANARGYVTIELRFPNRVKPKAIGMGDDIRELSIGIESATFR